MRASHNRGPEIGSEAGNSNALRSLAECARRSAALFAPTTRSPATRAGNADADEEDALAAIEIREPSRRADRAASTTVRRSHPGQLWRFLHPERRGAGKAA
jgi:hypothetical protein